MTKTTFYYNTYLSNCDSINKYNHKNKHQIYNIKSIVFDFPINQITDVLNQSLELKDINSKSYFLFYILFYVKPYINYKVIKSHDKNYSLKSSLIKLKVSLFQHHSSYLLTKSQT